MRRVLCGCVVLLFGHLLGAQTPVKSIEDGALDHIQLFVAALDQGPSLTVVIKPFDASVADLGTGSKDGKDVRQEEAKTMQNEGPRVLGGTLCRDIGEQWTVQNCARAHERRSRAGWCARRRGQVRRAQSREPRQAILRRIWRRQVVGEGGGLSERLDGTHAGHIRSAAHRRDGARRRRLSRQDDERRA